MKYNKEKKEEMNQENSEEKEDITLDKLCESRKEETK